MGQVLHGSARTTEAVRRAIQRSEESVRALAGRGIPSPSRDAALLAEELPCPESEGRATTVYTAWRGGV